MQKSPNSTNIVPNSTELRTHTRNSNLCTKDPQERTHIQDQREASSAIAKAIMEAPMKPNPRDPVIRIYKRTQFKFTLNGYISVEGDED